MACKLSEAQSTTQQCLYYTHPCDLLYLHGDVGQGVDEVVEWRPLGAAGVAAEDVLVVQWIETAVVGSALDVGRVTLRAVVCNSECARHKQVRILCDSYG